MRKIPIIALAACLMMGVAGSAFAADYSTEAFVSSTTLTGGVFTPVIEMADLDGNTIADTKLTWSGINLANPATLTWKMADQCLKITGSMTKPGGVEIYTDNVNGTDFKYTGNVANWGNTPGNLINKHSANTLSANGLPMGWRVTNAPLTTAEARAIAAVPHDGSAKQDRIYNPTLGDGYPCWHWMEDKQSHGENYAKTEWINTFVNNDTTFVPGGATAAMKNASDYRIVKDTRGWQHAEAGWLGGGTPLFIYLGANFNAAVEGTYGTDTLTVHCYTE